MKIKRLKMPWRDIELCWLIRLGVFKSTPEVRQVAKQVSFARAYGFQGKIA